MDNYRNYFNSFYYLLKMDLIILFKRIFTELFDNSIWMSISVFCNGYLMPALGASSDFGAYLSVSQVVSVGVFLAVFASKLVVDDFEKERSIAYELILPLPSWMVFLKKSIGIALKGFLLGLVALPIGKLVLHRHLDLSYFSPLKFLLASMIVSVCVGSAYILLASVSETGPYSMKIWVRYVFPLWFFGGSIHPYFVMCKAFPLFAKILLLNPVVYSTEIVRAATLGPQSHVISFWTSFAVLCVLSVLFFWVGYRNLRKRYDFI